MKRISPDPYPSLCVTTASTLAALVAAVAATAIATAAAVAVISGSGAGSSLGSAIFIAAVLAAAASGLLAACIANPPATPPASISEDSRGRQIIIPLTTVQDGLKAFMHITKSRQPRPSRRRPPKKKHLPDDRSPIPPPTPKVSLSPSLAFHERCGRILQTCDLLVRHFPVKRSLCILRTAEGILARRPHRPVEPEPTWESDIDVDLDPVLSAPDLDEALRRLDQRIRTARTYKERNERLQSTSLVLEAEKRRAIRSAAEQYLALDDPLTPEITSETMPPIPVRNDETFDVCAAFYPKPKARTSLFLTESSIELSSPEITEALSEDVSITGTLLRSTEKEMTGFTCSQRDFTSSVVEMDLDVTSASQSTINPSLQNKREVFSSSSLEKETESVPVSPLLIQNKEDLFHYAEIPTKTEVVFPTSTISDLPSNETEKKELQSTPIENDEVSCSNETEGRNKPLLIRSSSIEKKEVLSTLTENDEVFSSSETEVGDKSSLLWSSSLTAIAEETLRPDILLVAESDDDESGNWSSLVEAVACGLTDTKAVSISPNSIDTKDLTPAYTEGEYVSIPFGCEKTNASSLDKTIPSPPTSNQTQYSALPLSKSEAVSISLVCEKNDASSPDEKIPSSSATIETEDLTPSLTKSETVSISSVCERTGERTGEDSWREDCALEESVPSPSNSIEAEDSTLSLTRSKAVSTSPVCDNNHASSSAEIASLSLNVEMPDSTPQSFEHLHKKPSVSEYFGKTEYLDVPDTTNIGESDMSPEFIIANKTPICDNISTKNDNATTGVAAAPIETQFISDTDSRKKGISIDSNLTTVKEDNILNDKSISKCAVSSKLTADLNVTPLKVEDEFEQLLESISPSTDDIEESFTAVSSDISSPNETISDETRRMDTCVQASVRDANEGTRFSSHVAEAAMGRVTFTEKDSEILISDGESKLCMPDLDPETHQKDLESPGKNANLRVSTPMNTSFGFSNEERRVQSTEVIQCRRKTEEESVIKPAKLTLSIEENEAVADLIRTTHSSNETELKFDREVQSFDVNLDTEIMSDCASDSSSMSVSPNPDISFLRTYETNPSAQSSKDAIKVDFPEARKEFLQQTAKTMDDFGFGEPLMVVTARKVTTYVDDIVCPTQRKDRNFAQKRRVRISTQDLNFEDVPEVQERKIGFISSSPERRGGRTPYRFESICRDSSPPKTNIRKPLKPEAFRPFSSKKPGSVEDEESCADALPGNFFRSLERRDDTQLSTFDHSSPFSLSMRVPHRRAFWDCKMKESKNESPKRHPSIKMTGIVQKCKETFQTLSSSSDSSSPTTIQENDLPGNHERRFREARCFFQNLEGKSEHKNIPIEPTSEPDSTASATPKPRKRLYPATVAERFNVTGIYEDVLGDGAAKTAAGAPLRGVPRREAVVATLHSFQK